MEDIFSWKINHWQWGQSSTTSFSRGFFLFFPFPFLQIWFSHHQSKLMELCVFSNKVGINCAFSSTYFLLWWKVKTQFPVDIRNSRKWKKDYTIRLIWLWNDFPLVFSFTLFFFSRSSKKKRTLMVSHLCFVYLLWKCWKEVNSESWIPFSGNQNHIKKKAKDPKFSFLCLFPPFSSIFSATKHKSYTTNATDINN